MNQTLIEKIVRAVLYEGYILYPYRPCVKTQQRWTFGGIFPRAFAEAQPGSDSCLMQGQLLQNASADDTISLSVSFLHLTQRTVEAVENSQDQSELKFYPVLSMEVAGRQYQTWQEAVERTIKLTAQLKDIADKPCRQEFSFPHQISTEELTDGGKIVGRLVREQQRIDGVIEFAADCVANGLYQLSARVMNESNLTDVERENRDLAQLKSFASSHMVLSAQRGGFVSPTDPPEALAQLSATCRNIGCWPVLVGNAPDTDAVLVSPIILADYPQIAPESPGDLFDGGEIDEILTLRILTLTDEEKRQATAVDPLAADMLARTEALARDQLMNLHGSVRPLKMAAASERESKRK